jgi:transposase
MPKERLSMRTIREILRLRFEMGLSQQAIGVSCRLGTTTVHDYLTRARAAGLSWPLPAELDDAAIEALLFPATAPSRVARPAPDWPTLHQELRRKSVTLGLLWQEYKAGHPDGFQFSRFCQLYHQWAATIDPVLRQHYIAGEKLMVDWAGQTVPVTDRATGEIREAQIFVAVSAASNYTYLEATWTQELANWIGAHRRCFEFMGGVHALLIPDNTKTGVTSPCRYEPVLNPTYQDLAAHYGTAVVPARVRRPRDKAKVETAVQGIERQILARLRHRAFFLLAELNHALWEELAGYNRRPFQKLEGCRQSLFEQLEKPVLKPLPTTPYQFATWKRARVSIDYHIEVERHYYSVPYGLVGREVDVRLTPDTVEILDRGKRVASHLRSPAVGRHTTIADHMPRNHRARVEWDPPRLIRWAQRTGPQTAQLVERILASPAHPEQGFRSCLGILRLGRSVGPERLEAACARALTVNALSYRSIDSILKLGLDSQPLPAPLQAVPPICHANIRGADYYAPTKEITDAASPDPGETVRTETDRHAQSLPGAEPEPGLPDAGL